MVILDCTQCREIVKRVQSKIAGGNLDNYKAQRYGIIVNDPITNPPETQTSNHSQNYKNEFISTYSGESEIITSQNSYAVNPAEENKSYSYYPEYGNNFPGQNIIIGSQSSYLENPVVQNVEYNHYNQNYSYSQNFIDQQALISPTPNYPDQSNHLNYAYNYEQINYISKNDLINFQSGVPKTHFNQKTQSKFNLSQNNQTKKNFASPNLGQYKSIETNYNDQLNYQTFTNGLCSVGDKSSVSYSKI